MMKLEMDLKPGDVVLLKFLACVVIAFFMGRFLILPGIEKHQNLIMEREELTRQKEQMETVIANAPAVEETIKGQISTLADKREEYYGLLENQAVDELITGVILKNNLFPVYLSIADPVAGVPEAYFLSAEGKALQQAEDAAAAAVSSSNSIDDKAAAAVSSSNSIDDKAAAAEEAANDTGEEDSFLNDTIDAYVQYTNATEVSVTVQGSEDEIRAFLDDIAVSYPGIQVRSFNIQEGTYLDQNLQAIDSINCSCVLAVYTCGDLTDPAFGEETDNQ